MMLQLHTWNQKQSARVFCQSLGQHLQCDVALQLGVAGRCLQMEQKIPIPSSGGFSQGIALLRLPLGLALR
jgi:hypothetical protein